jgi:hypothetical protein
MKKNAFVAKMMAGAATGIVADSPPKVAKMAIRGGTGIVGDILLNPSEANAMDDIAAMKS